MREHLLLVDDEQHFLRALAANLRGRGLEVETAASGAEALERAALSPPQAVLLDLRLGDLSGTEVTRELRQWYEGPIILISVVGDEREKIAALDAGADDYVTKPFAVDELLARLRAVLRRAREPGEPVIAIGDLCLDVAKQAVTVKGALVHLTPIEYALLLALAESRGKLMTHSALLRRVWGLAYEGEASYLHVYVSQLRRKLEAAGCPRLILTEPRAGYRLIDPGEEEALRSL